jgi:hypothetical protein
VCGDVLSSRIQGSFVRLDILHIEITSRAKLYTNKGDGKEATSARQQPDAWGRTRSIYNQENSRTISLFTLRCLMKWGGGAPTDDVPGVMTPSLGLILKRRWQKVG